MLLCVNKLNLGRLLNCKLLLFVFSEDRIRLDIKTTLVWYDELQMFLLPSPSQKSSSKCHLCVIGAGKCVFTALQLAVMKFTSLLLSLELENTLKSHSTAIKYITGLLFPPPVQQHFQSEQVNVERYDSRT